MGADCTGCSKGLNKGRLLNDYSMEPQDTWEYSPDKKPNLIDLRFDGLLSNIKIYNCPKESISLKFIIEDILEALLPRKMKSQDNNEIKWKSRENFNFTINQFQLRKRFLYIQSTDQHGKILATLKINLYFIATGPYHHDFSFKLGKTQCRLQFDLKISQTIKTQISFKKVEMHLNKKYFEAESLYFNVRILKQNIETPFQSTPSYTQTLKLDHPVPAHQPAFNSQIDQCQSPIRFRGKNKLLDNTKIIWNVDKGEMPQFKIFIHTYDIKNSLMHFVVWKADAQQATVFGEMHIPTYKLYSEVVEEVKSPLTSNQSRDILLSRQKLSNHEDYLGEMSILLQVVNSKYLKQMKACARTQKGIISMVPLVNLYGINFQNKKDKLTAINESVLMIEKMNIEINQNVRIDNKQIAIDRRKKMLEQFMKLRSSLQDTLEQSYAMPTTQSDILKIIEDQSLLLSIVEKIEAYLQDDEVFTDICWHIILAVIKRGQFSLPNIGFRKKDQEQMTDKLSPILKKKIKVGLQYQQILYRLFLQSLKLGYIEGRQKPKPAIETFKAYCYFRIPAFRDILLKMVVRKEDQTVEWKTDNFDADTQFIKQTQDVLVFQLDWQLSFYKPLANESKSQSLNKDLVDNLEGNIWLAQVSKRGSTFFYFLHFLVKRLLQLGKKIKFIKWQYFPGYNKLVRSFLYQMKKLKVFCYPKSLLQTSVNLLSNEKLINVLLTTVFEKTNIFDCNQLMKGLQIINKYLKTLTKQKKIFPPTFNYVYFFKGLKNILQGQFSYAIMKTLGIIYNNYENFNIEFRKTLSLYLLGKIFFKLYLHWSHGVRSFFYHILVLKISRSSDVFNSECRKQFGNRHQLMNEITTRYQHVIKLTRSAEVLRKEQQSSNMFKRQEKQLYKTMKKKMYQRKRKNGGNKFKSLKSERKISQHESSKINLFGGNSYQKQKEPDSPDRPTSKYTLEELNKISKAQRTRSQSVVLDIQMVKMAQQNAKRNKDSSTKDEQKQLEDIVINRINSTDPKDTYTDDAWKDVNTTAPKKRARRMSFYASDDFEVQEISKKQVEYLPMAIKQFDSLDEAIRKYMVENGQLPVCDLDGFQIPYDEDIKPSTMAIDEWEPMTNILE